MKKLIIATALASSVLGSAAYADGTGPYIAIEGGAVKNERADISSAAGYVHSDRFKTGWEAGGALGYDFGHVRIEAEAFHLATHLKSQDRPAGSPPPNGTFEETSGLSGSNSADAMMGNVLFGMGHWGGLKAYAGGGAGVARTHLYENWLGSASIDGRETGFAWQALAGLTVPLSHNVDLGVRYRYFRPDGADHFRTSDGTITQGSLRSHSLLATLTFNFGGNADASPAAPMAPSAPPAASPPPPAAVPMPIAAICYKGPYIVFFDWNKADITAEASSILDTAIHAYGDCASVSIMLAGYTDSSGTARYNLGLSTRRDDAVQTYLTNHGITANTISTHAYGKTNQRVPTAEGVREIQNRRVEITYGPGSGN